MSSTEITATCHCKANVFTASVPTSSLPLETDLCQCDSCRRCSGALNTSAAPWPISVPENHSLQSYEFSKTLTILFCGKCSQKMFWQDHVKQTTKVFTACLPNDKGLVRFVRHIYVGDTKDGGASQWWMSPHPRTAAAIMPIPRWSEYYTNSEKLPLDWPAGRGLETEDELTGEDTLPIRCHCGGVRLTLARPDYPKADKEEVPWYVDPVSRRKWLTVMCCCDSCRLTHSADLVPLTFVDMKSIGTPSSSFPKNVTELSAAVAQGDASLGTLTKYQSSAEAFRFHCSRCSASVFYACDDRPELLDLAPGLLLSPDGARAEGMLWWKFSKGPNNHFGDVKGGWREEIVTSLEDEMHQWRKAKGWTVAE